MLCAECVMRRRLACWEKFQREPAKPTVNANPLVKVVDELPAVREAATVLNGTALCYEHIVECVQMQRQSALAAPNGQPFLLRPPGPTS